MSFDGRCQHCYLRCTAVAVGLAHYRMDQVRMGIVTTAKRADFENIHEQRKIRRFMDFILVREDYELSKPHPEPYLTGLAKR